MENNFNLLQFLKELALLFKDEKFEDAKNKILMQKNVNVDFEEVKEKFLETLQRMNREIYVENYAEQLVKKVDNLRSEIKILEDEIKPHNFFQKLFFKQNKEKISKLEKLKQEYDVLLIEEMQVREEMCSPRAPISWTRSEQLFNLFRLNYQKPNYKEEHQEVSAFWNYLKELYQNQ